MRIKLSNYANITSIDYEIENNKINFLFGISGAGKSSIAKSLTASEDTMSVKAGKEIGDCNVEIEDAPFTSSDDIAIYDYSFMEDVLIIKSHTEDVYSLLFADGERMKHFKAQYESLIGKLFLSKDRIKRITDQIRVLIKNLSLKFVNKI